MTIFFQVCYPTLNKTDNEDCYNTRPTTRDRAWDGPNFSAVKIKKPVFVMVMVCWHKLVNWGGVWRASKVELAIPSIFPPSFYFRNQQRKCNQNKNVHLGFPMNEKKKLHCIFWKQIQLMFLQKYSFRNILKNLTLIYQIRKLDYIYVTLK